MRSCDNCGRYSETMLPVRQLSGTDSSWCVSCVDAMEERRDDDLGVTNEDVENLRRDINTQAYGSASPRDVVELTGQEHTQLKAVAIAAVRYVDREASYNEFVDAVERYRDALPLSPLQRSANATPGSWRTTTNTSTPGITRAELDQMLGELEGST